MIKIGINNANFTILSLSLISYRLALQDRKSKEKINSKPYYPTFVFPNIYRYIRTYTYSLYHSPAGKIIRDIYIHSKISQLSSSSSHHQGSERNLSKSSKLPLPKITINKKEKEKKNEKTKLSISSSD